jgi:hydroxysqualene dehydroxylase
LRFLRARNVPIEFGHRLRALDFSKDRVVTLDFGEEKLRLGDNDCVILAVPAVVAAELVPALVSPNEFRAIVNAHFRIDPPPWLAPIVGVVNGTVEWLFSFKQRISVTISAADRLLDMPREALASKIWEEVAVVAQLPNAMPPWQIVRERRATFAATPSQNARRPGCATTWSNLFVAGDWTDTGLPATIEGAIRSGNLSAELAACL